VRNFIYLLAFILILSGPVFSVENNYNSFLTNMRDSVFNEDKIELNNLLNETIEITVRTGDGLMEKILTKTEFADFFIDDDTANPLVNMHKINDSLLFVNEKTDEIELRIKVYDTLVLNIDNSVKRINLKMPCVFDLTLLNKEKLVLKSINFSPDDYFQKISKKIIERIKNVEENDEELKRYYNLLMLDFLKPYEKTPENLEETDFIVRKYSEGSVYSGVIQNNIFNGFGRMQWSGNNEFTGHVYEGHWVDNVKEGFGVYNWNDGRVYEGHWQNNMMNDFGTYYYANGGKYVGEWKDDLRVGEGTYFLPGKMKFVGIFKNDLAESGIMYFPDSTRKKCKQNSQREWVFEN